MIQQHQNDLQGRYIDQDLRGKAVLCGAKLWGANFEGADLGRANLKGSDLLGANLKIAQLDNANLKGATLIHANFEGARLESANLEGANLLDANLKRAFLFSANLAVADLRYADLEGADLRLVNLEDIDLRFANLEAVQLYHADVANAQLAGANLTNANYSPVSAPNAHYLAEIEGLATLKFGPGQQSGLVQLRSLLRNAGLQDLEREATFALEHNKALHRRNDGAWPEQVDGWFKLVFFEWTTGWGLHPQRALLILLGLMVFLGVVIYPVPLFARLALSSPRHGIFKVQLSEEHEFPEGRVGTDEIIITRLTASTTLGAFGYGLWFSLLSAFHIGWRDLNVGTWLSRIQPSAYALRARGWVRVVSGTQSLLSVYLIALWALTYFGRPFG